MSAYLAAPTDAVDVEDPAGYFVEVLLTTTHDEVAERGRVAGRALGEDPAGSVRQYAAEATAALAAADGSTVVKTPAGGMRLLDYLPTRTFELTVHSLDLIAAIGVHRPLAAEPVAAATRLSVELAIRRGSALELLLALNHRRPLGRDFAVL